MSTPDRIAKRRRTRSPSIASLSITDDRFHTPNPPAKVESTYIFAPGSSFKPINSRPKRAREDMLGDDARDKTFWPSPVQSSPANNESSPFSSQTNHESPHSSELPIRTAKSRQVTHEMVIDAALSLYDGVQTTRGLAKKDKQVQNHVRREETKANDKKKQEDKQGELIRRRKEIAENLAEAILTGNAKEITKWTKLEERAVEREKRIADKEVEKQRRASEKESEKLLRLKEVEFGRARKKEKRAKEKAMAAKEPTQSKLARFGFQ